MEYSGYCESFVEAAYGSHGTRYLTAQADADAHAGQMHSGDTNPPAGALVFYSYTDSSGDSLGHVGISIGNGQVISTRSPDYLGRARAVRQHSVLGIVGGSLQYIGWSYADSSWTGR